MLHVLSDTVQTILIGVQKFCVKVRNVAYLDDSNKRSYGQQSFFLSYPFGCNSKLFFFFGSITEMYNNVGTQAGVTIPPTNSQPNPFGNSFYGAGSGLIRGGLGAYGEKILGSSSEYVQSNVSSI